MTFEAGRALRWISGMMALVLLASCGGGGGGGGSGTPSPGVTSISANPQSISFNVLRSSGVATQDITATFQGSGVVVGYPPGTAIPSWLQTSSGSLTGDGQQATFRIYANPIGVAPGVHRARLRLLTGIIPPGGTAADATNIVYVDVPVSMTVADLSVDRTSVALDVVRGSGPLSGSLTLTTASTGGWSATSDQDWLELESSSGTGTAVLRYRVAAGDLALGAHTAYIAVTDTLTGIATSVAVTLNVRAPRLVVAPAALSLAVTATTTPAQLTVPLDLSDELGGLAPDHAVSWRITGIDVPWLTAGVESGSSAPLATVPVTVDREQIAGMANGSHTGNLQIAYVAEDGLERTQTVPFTLTVNLPRVQQVAPYVVPAQSPHQIILRGTGFTGKGTAPLMIGDTEASGVTVLSDTEMRLTYPALAAGTHAVAVRNALGLALDARLVVRDEASLPGGIFTGGGSKRRIFLDNERNVLYGVDYSANQLDRFVLQGSSWVLQAPIYVTGKLVDAALSPDGKTVVLITEDMRVYELDLATEGAAPVQMARVTGDSYTTSSYYFRTVAFANNNVAVIAVGYRGSGSTPVYAYNRTTRTLGTVGGFGSNYYGLYNAEVTASADGSTVLLPQNGLSPAPQVASYNPSTGTGSLMAASMNLSVIAMSRDGGTMLASGNVYDRFFGLLGTLPYSSVNVVSPDGTRAYSYVMNSSTGNPVGIDVYDLTTRSGAGFARLGQIPLPASLRAPGAYAMAMTISLDGRTLFVWASAGLAVLPLPYAPPA